MKKQLLFIFVTCDHFFSPVVGHDASIMSPGQRFMTDLLVSSLMADGGLESALEAAIKNEISEIEGKKVSLHTCTCDLSMYW